MRKNKELNQTVGYVVEALQSGKRLSPSRLITMTKRKMYLGGHAPHSAVLRAKAISAIREAENKGLIRTLQSEQTAFCNTYELVRRE